MWRLQGTGDDQGRASPTLLEADLADEHVVKVSWAGLLLITGGRVWARRLCGAWALLAIKLLSPLFLGMFTHQAASGRGRFSRADWMEMGLLLPLRWPAARGTRWR